MNSPSPRRLIKLGASALQWMLTFVGLQALFQGRFERDWIFVGLFVGLVLAMVPRRASSVHDAPSK